MPRPITSKFLEAARKLKSADHVDPAPAKPLGDKLEGSAAPAAPTTAQVADKLMGRFDQNTDQKVGAQEMLSVIDPKGRFELISKMMDNLVS